ncbi:hypothetical protein F4823DRAFT_620127 [Ustulina deusta]|nr:hypothetical protein F4823DRAFT_620127 [Ustulina deusta]
MHPLSALDRQLACFQIVAASCAGTVCVNKLLIGNEYMIESSDYSKGIISASLLVANQLHQAMKWYSTIDVGITRLRERNLIDLGPSRPPPSRYVIRPCTAFPATV